MRVMCFLSEYRKGTLYIKNTMHIKEKMLSVLADIPICLTTPEAKLKFSHVVHICPVHT